MDGQDGEVFARPPRPMECSVAQFGETLMICQPADWIKGRDVRQSLKEKLAIGGINEAHDGAAEGGIVRLVHDKVDRWCAAVVELQANVFLHDGARSVGVGPQKQALKVDWINERQGVEGPFVQKDVRRAAEEAERSPASPHDALANQNEHHIAGCGIENFIASMDEAFMATSKGGGDEHGAQRQGHTTDDQPRRERGSGYPADADASGNGTRNGNAENGDFADTSALREGR